MIYINEKASSLNGHTAAVVCFFFAVFGLVSFDACPGKARQGMSSSGVRHDEGGKRGGDVSPHENLSRPASCKEASAEASRLCEGLDSTSLWQSSGGVCSSCPLHERAVLFGCRVTFGRTEESSFRESQ